MRKADQLLVNEAIDKSWGEVWEAQRICNVTWTRLRTCQPEVAKVECFYVLKSYSTVVAWIDTRTDTLYDFLREVYGYTTTSAQHISKFEKDYCAGKWNCAERLTWREV